MSEPVIESVRVKALLRPSWKLRARVTALNVRDGTDLWVWAVR